MQGELSSASERLEQLQNQLIETREALRAQQDRFRDIIERNADGILVVDREGIIRFTNRAAENLLNRRSGELSGSFLGFPLVAGEITEIDLFRPDGRQMVAEMHVTESEWDGRAVYLATLRDITERRAAETALAWEASVNEVMAELSRALITASVSVDEIAHLVLERAQNLTRSRFGFVGYIDPQTGYLVCPTMTRTIWDVCQVDDKRIVFETFGGLWGWVLENRQPLLTNSPSEDPRSSGIPGGHVSIKRFLSVPAMVHGELVGQIALANSDQDYTERDLTVIERLASLYALTIQRRQAEDALRERVKELACLYALHRDFQEEYSFETIFQRAVEYLIPAMQFPEISVAVIEIYARRFVAGPDHSGLAHGLEASIKVQGEVQGQLWVYYTERKPFIDPEEQNLVNAVAEALGLWLERKRMEEQLAYMARHDSLTGLPNRVIFHDHLHLAISQVDRNRHKAAVFMLDLDNFKDVNDTLGHSAGDQLLQDVGGRMQSLIRNVDTLARIGGDEFSLLLPEISGRQAAAEIAERLIGAFQEPFVILGHEFLITFSLGIAIYPDDGEDANSLLKKADLAMYRAKQTGRNKYQLVT